MARQRRGHQREQKEEQRKGQKGVLNRRQGRGREQRE